ncbi:CPBP family intramembrane metalloprotease [bacterium AH-315-F18]|nr:CPBP family intramembrane metalloprotease [bacterium AH-315-F18]
MTLDQAAQNFVFFTLPIVVYAIVVKWRSKLAVSEITNRLGITLGTGRHQLYAVFIAIPCALAAAWASSMTSGFEGSMIAPFVNMAPTRSLIAGALIYGVLATGLPEELLFRGLIAGALFRRMSFWKANFLQSIIFLLPHLLILFIVPRLWPLAIVFPMALGLASGWLRESSGSVLPSVVLHALPNVAGALWVLDWAK